MTTPNFSIPEIQSNQAQKHVTANEAFTVIDAAMDRTVVSAAVSTPPGSPSEGDKYIVASGATGDWSGNVGSVACYIDATWIFFTPKEGWEYYDLNTSTMLRYTGSAWEEAPVGSFLSLTANGAGVKLSSIEEELTSLSGATVTSSAAFPNQSLMLSVSLRVTTSITGATSFDCGDSGSASRFGGSLGITAGTTNQGTIGPTGNYASTPVVLTANGGNFTGGDVRIALHYLEFIAPTS
ncbi:ribonuclease III [Dinoroseobacter phage vB_DshS-R5C]|uniref:Ribonuclease III n=1 Tax=Dinoroseobacter phage vB_DshS-R5C TaxID=1965368 RepID=A0A1V0DY81_9CAUD|nr:ribonuclease III [Dinoroseobacter phage vB_DshS-R5C]ARB06122.1 ribonuclease III [Dinoroseobacter phage vB_DshS-R5C]